MTNTIIDLEDYYGNTMQSIEIKDIIIDGEDVEIDGYDWADTDGDERSENILRFQKIEK
jgi:hypothetical protein